MSEPKLEDKFKQLIATLDPQQSSDEKVRSIQNLLEPWKQLFAVRSSVKGSKVLMVLTSLLEENKTTWEKKYPKWIAELMNKVTEYSGVPDLFPPEQIIALSNAVRKYIMSSCTDALYTLKKLGDFNVVRQHLLNDLEFLTNEDTLKKLKDNKDAVACLGNFAFAFEGWQLKLLSDKSFILDLLRLPEDATAWNLLINIAQHTDAKTLMPPEVIVKASKSDYFRIPDLCSLICSDNDLKTIKPSGEWISQMVMLLHTLLSKGAASANSKNYNLLDLVLPVANLSSIDSQKDELGRAYIPLLMELVTRTNLPDKYHVQKHLVRGRHEASRALWNFAYLPSNRILIAANDGIANLTKALSLTQDPILLQNINGILYMYHAPAKDTNQSEKKGHVMISYNWANQPIVKRIAVSLQERGYNIWLDVEQMAGSTLEAMADAVEQSSLMLICMSQKYKDSPNCRLEGEYCINRRVGYVPLMMQQGYRPDGWLGIALGAKLWLDFTDDSNWDSKITELVKAIGAHGKDIKHTPQPIPASTPIPEPKSFVGWTLQDIQEWLTASNLENLFSLFERHRFDGVALAELKRLHSLQQPSFFNQFCAELGITDMGDRLRLSAVIHKL